MARMTMVPTAGAEGRTRELYDHLERTVGAVPNLAQVMGSSPAALELWVNGLGSLDAGRLGHQLLERIALHVAALNACDYCATAHAFLGSGAGLTDGEVRANLRGEAADDHAAAALRFAGRVVETRGAVADGDLADVRAAGFDDGQITEIIAAVALNTFTNYLNRAAQTEIDFPRFDRDGA